MFKKLITVCLFLVGWVGVNAQILNPVEWTFEQKELEENTFELTFKAKIDKGWYIYSQNIEGDGPIPTSFNFDALKVAKLEGITQEAGPSIKEGVDEMFDIFIKKFAKEATFTQKVKISGDTEITGYLEFMTCDKEQCLPPESIDFNFKLKYNNGEETTEVETDVSEESSDESIENEVFSSNPTSISFNDDEPVSLNPVSWEIITEQLNDKKIEIRFRANIDEGWYVYAQKIDDDGPIPTSFTFEENDNVEIKGYADEQSDHTKKGFDAIFEMNVKKFAKKVDFVYKLKPENQEGILKGYLEFMTCNDKACLPPEFVDFEIDLATLETKIGEELVETNTTEVSDTEKFRIAGLDLNNPISDCGEPPTEDEQGESSLWVIFLLGFGGGLLALLTPCVFPMIPLTVSYFTKGSGDRKKGLFNAVLYGFFIFLVYVLISIPFHLLDSLDPDILNSISTNVGLNIFFFLIFVFFAFSFFGYYEIALPSSLANKSSSAEGIGGVLGIFFMALTLAIVSFSCTGPILGSLLALSSEAGGGANQLSSGMAGFGLALALPFTLFAAFPGMMNSLPKSGGWLTTVKVVLGFLELALAFKFLSNADLVKHWGLLKYEVFIGIWIIIFILLAIYMIGKLKFPHDSPLKKISFPRMAFAILVFAFVIYLASAFRYNDKTKTFNSLGLLSGLAPPAGYSWIYPNPCPQNFSCFHDFYEAQAFAQKEGKPLMIDFTGHACVNCRKVEENVWPIEEIRKTIDEEYVLVSLYVDEKIDLPEEEKETVEYNGKTKTLRTTGDKWAYMEYSNFKRVSQPYYVLMSPDGVLLNDPIGYSSASDYEDVYLNFLECGLEAYESIK